MRYLPHTEEDIASMLQEVGAKDLDELFCSVPEKCRSDSALSLEGPFTEWETKQKLSHLADRNAVAPEYKIYLGAGSYEHFIPETLTYLLGRSEFLTAYTPYQPEVSQGTLQAIYEYQTLVGNLLGMEVANASVYDGASALAEALLMAVRITRKKKIAISRLTHPYYRQVVETYLGPSDYQVIELPFDSEGRTDFSEIDDIDDMAAISVQSPNFFGIIEDLDCLSEKAHEKGALFVLSFTEALAYGLLKSPGNAGADIVCGEGQSLGIPPTFGGPGLGIFASRKKYMRNMPGRLVGQTVDKQGKRGFVLTLSTREQHIRREKATSNICTNNSLCALAAAIYMASLGGEGLRELARINHDKAEYLKTLLRKEGFKIPFSGPTFNEFVVEFPEKFSTMSKELSNRKIIAGLPMESFYPEMNNHRLFCVTETKSKEDIDALVEGVKTCMNR